MNSREECAAACNRKVPEDRLCGKNDEGGDSSDSGGPSFCGTERTFTPVGITANGDGMCISTAKPVGF